MFEENNTVNKYEKCYSVNKGGERCYFRFQKNRVKNSIDKTDSKKDYGPCRWDTKCLKIDIKQG